MFCPKFSCDLRRDISLHTPSKIQEVISDTFASWYLLQRTRSPASRSMLQIAFPPRTSAGNTSIGLVRYRGGGWFLSAPRYGEMLMCPFSAKGGAILSALQKGGFPSVALQTAPSWWWTRVPGGNWLTPAGCCLWRTARSRVYRNLLSSNGFTQYFRSH